MIFRHGDYNKDSYRCRTLIIGTGAGGSVAGALLAEQGHDVIMLEEGAYHTADSFVASVGASLSHLYRNHGVSPFFGTPPVNFLEACCVGGGTVVNGALLWRPEPYVLAQWKQTHGLQGYDYADLERHFKTIEKDLHVETQKLDPVRDLNSLLIKQGAEQLGWKAVPVPRAALNCSNLNRCMAGCPTGAKQSALQTYLPRALAKGVRLFTACRAVKVKHSQGIAHEVIAEVKSNGRARRIIIHFDHLIVAGGAVQTPFLLRRSGISKMAGTGIQFNYSLKMAARFDRAVYAEKSSPFTIQVQEFLNDGLIINVSQFNTLYLALALTHYSNEVVNRVMDNQDQFALYIGFMSSLSHAHLINVCNNIPVVWYRQNRHDFERIKTTLRRMAALLFKSGVIEIYLPLAVNRPVCSMAELEDLLTKIKPGLVDLVTVHVMSACPMGTNPQRSVVDPWGRVWGMKNVVVCDASILPSCFGESPQETIMAFAHEVMGRQIERSRS
ncbi:MAG: GMC family oxidoreductase [Deltaproteobacteria bacterium]|nr:GMC family oxidoreductase [Deltaproteobacteria bacterium]